MRSTRSRAPREHTARLARLHQFDRAIGEAESIEAIAEIAVRHLRELTRCRHASVITFDFVTGLATVAAEYSGGREPRRGGSRWPMDSADIPGELKSGRVALIDSSASAEPSSPPPPLFGHEAGQRYLSVPLMAKGELIGALVLGSASPNAFTLADVETSLWMAESVATAIERARRHDQLLRHAVKLERRLNDFQRKGMKKPLVLSEVLGAQERERQRIAADIHDDSAQVLAAAMHRLAGLRRELTESRHAEVAKEIEETIALAIGRLRRLMFELIPPALKSETLRESLEKYLERVSDEAELRVRVDDRLSDEPGEETRTVAYRVAQEAVTNVVKHADASRVVVTLEDRDGGSLLTVSDDGKGFSLRDAIQPGPDHLGITTMRQRAEMAGGWCRVDSRPGAGTTVACWLPGEATVSVAEPTGTVILPG